MDGYITTDAYGTQIYTYNTTFNASYMPEEASIYTVNSQNGTVRKLFTGTYFYGLGVSPSTGNIFTAEVSFTSNSLMKVVGADGNLKSSSTSRCRHIPLPVFLIQQLFLSILYEKITSLWIIVVCEYSSWSD
jgi:hypothetical protein